MTSDTMHSGKPAVVVVILNWNKPTDTLACLSSVQALTYPNVVPLVVDNGSTDDSVQQIRTAFPKVQVLETGENLGYAEGNNMGLRTALTRCAEFILILNNDVTIAADALTLLVETMQADPRIGIAGPAVYFANPTDQLFAVGSSILWHVGAIKHVTEGVPLAGPRDSVFLPGCALCVRREVVQSVGMLDPAYYLNWEDVEWCVRINRHGWLVRAVPVAKVWHGVSSSLGRESPQNTYYMTRNALLFFNRNAPGIWRLLAPLQILLRTIWAISAWTLKPQYRNDTYRQKRDANLLAMRDFFLRNYGKMGQAAARACRLER